MAATVLTQPGQTAFTLIPLGPSSFARLRMKPIFACFEEQYVLNSLTAVFPHIDDVRIIRPPGPIFFNASRVMW